MASPEPLTPELPSDNQDKPESARTSVYLDASEDGPSVAEILQELREIPDVIAPSELATTWKEEPATVPICRPSARRRSSVRHSFSSSVHPSRSKLRASASRSASGSYDRAEATVELHEESAAAFQDFLLWAYPHLDCKVTWGNVEDVSAI